MPWNKVKEKSQRHNGVWEWGGQWEKGWLLLSNSMFRIGHIEKVHFQNDSKEIKWSVEGKIHSLTILVIYSPGHLCHRGIQWPLLVGDDVGIAVWIEEQGASWKSFLYLQEIPTNGDLHRNLLLDLRASTFWARYQNYNTSARENRESKQVGEARIPAIGC